MIAQNDTALAVTMRAINDSIVISPCESDKKQTLTNLYIVSFLLRFVKYLQTINLLC